MNKKVRKRELFPPWQMPSDPVKAVFWFMQWLLRVTVRYFWIIIIAAVLFETYINWRTDGIVNGLVAGSITLFVCLIIWAILYGALFLANVSSSVSQVISDVKRMQEDPTSQSPFSTYSDRGMRGKVVEGSLSEVEEPPQQKQE